MSMLASDNPVIWFEIPVSDLERAIGFYEAIFDIHLQPMDLDELKMAFFPMKQDAPNATGALVYHKDMYWPSHEGPLLYFTVHDIDAVLDRVRKQGSRIFQNGKKEIGEFGFAAYFEDSEGNRIALHSRT